MKKPTKHQKEDARKLQRQQAHACFSAVGTGKTLTALHAIKLDQMKSKTGPHDHGPTLIVCPPIAGSMWLEEAVDYLGGKAHLVRSSDEPLQEDTDIVITSYNLASMMKKQLWENPGGAFRTVVLDEAHNLKNPEAARTKAIYGPHCTLKRGICAGAHRVYPLTGTPIQNRLSALGSIAFTSLKGPPIVQACRTLVTPS